ncbi:helix-turn-helix domain-containing protein [Paraconexibacter antarcticus]|uniref:Helix-turn-helix domain-containing protein n=1 Tax=Paraconexibacter antarcticus TaxID=2949664 RepID=A0ABY5DT07_9ACTN|nr:helix-turn-helix domain-containing protein [Paraconexibacter antarcticus]UTI64393.1 helix-turn-helix domain-containing protein [Paraconexibacter antarcticus]
MPPVSRDVALVLLEGAVLYDVGIALQVFGPRAPRPDRPDQPYALTPCGVRRGTITTMSGLRVGVDAGLEAIAAADLVIVPGTDVTRPVPPRLLDALRAAHAGGARMLSICTGAFILAEAGLLDGRHATTHWGYCADLAARFPQVRVDPDVLYVDDGDILTSAGLSAGMDLCLHVVRQELGAEVANGVARWNVVPPHRAGGQAQFIRTPVPDAPGGGLGPTLSWAQAHLRDRLDVTALARHAHMSERTFARRFRAETGLTPKQWLLTQRVLHARRLLERTDLDIEAVATEAGFGSAASLRIHFRRATSTRPTAYRATFRDAAPAAA